MKAEELRIGNLVYPDMSYPEPVKVCPKDFLNTEHLNSIPLTEEWLLKFGFEYEHIENNHYSILHPKGFRGQYKIHFFPTINNMWHLAFSDKISGKHEDYIPTTHILYVHQLQNLYFALTGEELTIKE